MFFFGLGFWFLGVDDYEVCGASIEFSWIWIFIFFRFIGPVKEKSAIS